jgi:hypothetical protein
MKYQLFGTKRFLDLRYAPTDTEKRKPFLLVPTGEANVYRIICGARLEAVDKELREKEVNLKYQLPGMDKQLSRVEFEWHFKEHIREIFKEGFVRFGSTEKLTALRKKLEGVCKECDLDFDRKMNYLIYGVHQENNPSSLGIRARRVSLLHACGLGDFIPHQLQD